MWRSGVREKFLKISKTPSLTAAKATESICFPRHKVRSLQRFQRMRIEEKGHNAHECDAMIVKPRLLVGVSGDYDFAEVVFDVAKGNVSCSRFARSGMANADWI